MSGTREIPEITPEEWDALTQLIKDVKDKVGDVDRKLKHGTQEEKLDVLKQKLPDVTTVRLSEIHDQLETIFYKGSLPFWWW